MLSASVLLWYHRQSRKGKPMHAASDSSFQACRPLLSSRFAGCFYARFRNGSAQSCASLSASGRFEAFLSARFDSAISHHMAHGLDNPQGRTCNLPCQEKALESLPRCSFPDRMCANQQPRRRTGAVFICRLSAVWSAARVCRHGWFESKGGVLYSRSSIGRALVSKTKGCRLGPCRECQTLHDRGTACRE